jgi:hypothetical protein
MAGDTKQARPPVKKNDVEAIVQRPVDMEWDVLASMEDVEYDHDAVHYGQDVGKLATLYRVNIANHTFEIVGNEETGKFSWTNAPMNECLKKLVVLPDRMAVINAQVNEQTRKMMVFDNHGRGMCSSLAFLLYLCAADKITSMNRLLTMLTGYIKEHYYDHNAKFDNSYGEYFDRFFGPKSAERIELCSRKGNGLMPAHYDAFAKVFNVPVREFKIFHHPAMDDSKNMGRSGVYSSRVYSQIGPAIEYRTYSPLNSDEVSSEKWCNLLILDNRDGTGHAVLLGDILSEELL